MTGVRFARASGLANRAVAEVEKGPRTSSDLAREVLGVRNAAPDVARRVVAELFSDHPGVAFRDGAWRREEPEEIRDAPLDELEYVVVDVETTGGSPARGDRITEIAAVHVRNGGIAGEFSSLVNPGRPIPPAITQLTGIDEEMVRDAPAFEEVSDRVRKEMEGRVFVAHNVPFDWRFVTAEMRRARSLRPEGPRLCTLRMARRALPGLSSKGLDSVTRYFGVEIRDRHRAAGDALATAAVLLHLLDEADRRGLDRWGRLERWLSGRLEC